MLPQPPVHMTMHPGPRVTASPGVIGTGDTCIRPRLQVCLNWGYAGDGLHSARLKLCCSMPCCLSPPLLELLHLCGLARGLLLLSFSFDSHLSICAGGIPKPTSSQTWSCFQPPPAHCLACTGCLLGSGACLSALLTSLGN